MHPYPGINICFMWNCSINMIIDHCLCLLYLIFNNFIVLGFYVFNSVFDTRILLQSLEILVLRLKFHLYYSIWRVSPVYQTCSIQSYRGYVFYVRVFRLLVNIYKKISSPHYISILQFLVFLDKPESVAIILKILLGSKNKVFLSK